MYNTVDHGSTVEIDVEDVDQEALFSETALALSGVLTEARGGTAVTHDVAITAPDLEGLLVAWVNELIGLADRDGFIAERSYKERLDGGGFRAKVAGEKGIPGAEIRSVRCRSIGVRRLPDAAWSVRIHLDCEG